MDAVLLETSLSLVDTPDASLDSRFSALLRERHPAVRPAGGDIAARQAKLLRSAVISVVDHLDDPVWLSETLGEPGGRRTGREVGPEMCEAVTECMVAAMAEIGGTRWTPQMTDAWVEALDAVSALMLLGREGDAGRVG